MFKCLFISLNLQERLARANIEVTTKGAAYIAGFAGGIWDGLDDLKRLPEEAQEFKPNMDDYIIQKLYQGWRARVGRVTHKVSSKTQMEGKI